VAAMQILSGVAASPGLFAGPVAHIDAATVEAPESGDPVVEAERLKSAIQNATSDLSALVSKLEEDEDAATILEFQIAMLEDDELSGPAFASIKQGQSASSAWAAVLDEQVAEYAGAEDSYFQARCADIADIRDRVLATLTGKAGAVTAPGCVLVGKDITPSLFLGTDWSAGGAIAVAMGSPSSHVAMLARSRGVPMITGLGELPTPAHEYALVNADTGEVIFSPDADKQTAFDNRLKAALKRQEQDAAGLAKPAVTADGYPVTVMVNIAGPSDLELIDSQTCDGVGLMRSEFLFYGRDGLPGEEDQYQAYSEVLRWAGDKPVVIRTLDAGGDKPIDGVTIEESNPFLGCRGIRLSLRNTDLFKIQLRALARAAVHGNLKVMLPMVTVPEEISRTVGLLAEVLEELQAEGTPMARPDLGIMVEVPSVAICPELFTEADFFSIGSNDLAQYVTAASRDSSSVADLNTARSPAVLHLIENVARAGTQLGVPVSLCGDAGSDLAVLPELIRRNIMTVSVAPAALASVKAAIRTLNKVEVLDDA